MGVCSDLEWPYVFFFTAGLGVIVCGDWLTEWARANYAAGSSFDKRYARRIPPWSAVAAGVGAVIVAGVQAARYVTAGCVSHSGSAAALILAVVGTGLALFAFVWLLVTRLREPRAVAAERTADGDEPPDAGNFFMRVRMPPYRWKALYRYLGTSSVVTVIAGIAFAVA